MNHHLQRKCLCSRSSWTFYAINPLHPIARTFGRLYFTIRRDHRKKFLWAPRLWVGRRKEAILGYITKIDGKQNSDGKWLINIWRVYKVPSLVLDKISIWNPPMDHMSEIDNVKLSCGIWSYEITDLKKIKHLWSFKGALRLFMRYVFFIRSITQRIIV